MTNATGREYESPALNKYGDLEELTKGMGQTGFDNMSQREATGPTMMNM